MPERKDKWAILAEIMVASYAEIGDDKVRARYLANHLRSAYRDGKEGMRKVMRNVLLAEAPDDETD